MLRELPNWAAWDNSKTRCCRNAAGGKVWPSLRQGECGRSPGVAPPGDLRRCGWYLDVVAPGLHVEQKRREGGPADHVRPVLGTGAVTHRSHTRQIGRDLY